MLFLDFSIIGSLEAALPLQSMQYTSPKAIWNLLFGLSSPSFDQREGIVSKLSQLSIWSLRMACYVYYSHFILSSFPKVFGSAKMSITVTHAVNNCSKYSLSGYNFFYRSVFKCLYVFFYAFWLSIIMNKPSFFLLSMVTDEPRSARIQQFMNYISDLENK